MDLKMKAVVINQKAARNSIGKQDSGVHGSKFMIKWFYTVIVKTIGMPLYNVLI